MEKKSLIKFNLNSLNKKIDNMGKGVFENNYSYLWENQFEQKTEILKDNGKTTHLVVKVNPLKLSEFFTKDKK